MILIGQNRLMEKEKKISVAFKHVKTKNYTDLPNSIQCRVVYDRKTTTFNVRLINDGIRCSDDDFKANYQDNNNWFNYFEKWVKNIVRYEVKEYGKKFELKGLASRIDSIYLENIRGLVVGNNVRISLLKALEGVLIYKAYKELEKRNFSHLSITNETNIHSFEFMEKVRYLIEDLKISLDDLPLSNINQINLLINLILFDHKISLRKPNRNHDYVYGFLNIGDWVGDKNLKLEFVDFLKNRIVVMPQSISYLNPFIKKYFPSSDKPVLLIELLEEMIENFLFFHTKKG